MNMAGSTRRALLVAVIAFVAFAGSIPNTFAFDDREAILKNEVVQGGVPVFEAFARDFWGAPPEKTVGSYRPVPVVSLALEWKSFGGRPWPMHAVSVLLHALVWALAYLVFRSIVGEKAALAGALFGVVFAASAESVQGLVGRADLLQAVALLVGLWAHRRAGTASAAGAGVAHAFALLCKESSFIAPFAWGWLDLVASPATPLKRRWGRFAVYVASSGAYLGLRVLATGSVSIRKTDALYNALAHADVSGRVFGAGRIFAERYLLGMLDPTRRLYDCSAPACNTSDPTDAVAWLGLAMLVLLSVLPFVLARKAPAVAVGLGWFAVFFIPVSNVLVPATLSYGERLLYVPMLGGAMAVGGAVALVSSKMTKPALAWSALAAVGLGNLVALQWRHGDWHSNATLYPSALRYAADSVVVQGNNAGVAYDAGDFLKAESHARRAIELWPTDPYGHKMLAIALLGQNRLAESERAFRQAIDSNAPSDIVVDFASFLARQKRYEEALAIVRIRRVADPVDAGLANIEKRLEQALDRRNEASFPGR